MKRIKQLIRVLWREGFRIYLPYVLAFGFLNMIEYWVFAKEKQKKEWRRRYRICLKCPIFDYELRRCRPFDNSKRGCGCYVPFSNVFYDVCWGRKAYGKAVGWSYQDSI